MTNAITKLFSIHGSNKKDDKKDDKKDGKKKKTRRGVKTKRNKALEAISKSFAGDAYKKED